MFSNYTLMDDEPPLTPNIDESLLEPVVSEPENEPENDLDPSYLESPDNVPSNWSDLIKTQCSFIQHLISQDEGHSVDLDKLETYMRDLKLEPCDGKENCLQRNCAILWQFYVAQKTKRSKTLKRVGDTVGPKRKGDIQVISMKLFDEARKYRFRPSELSLMYDMLNVPSNDIDNNVDYSTHEIRRRKPSAILRRYKPVNPAVILSNERMQVALTQYVKLQTYFLVLYTLRTEASVPQPNLRRRSAPVDTMYVLLESSDGNIVDFQQRYQRIDSLYWSRVQRMLIIALQGLIDLRKEGLALNDVRRHTLHYQIDWDKFLLGAKWGNYDNVTVIDEADVNDLVPSTVDPLYKNHDKFAFGIMVFEILFGAHPDGILGAVELNDWQTHYKNITHDTHENMTRLLDPEIPPEMQELAKTAFRFIVHPDIAPRWSFKDAVRHLNGVTGDNSQRTMLTETKPDLTPYKAPRPFLDW